MRGTVRINTLYIKKGVNMDKQRLIQYLKNVVDLEKQVYLQKRALYQLDKRIKSLGHAADIRQKSVGEVNGKDILLNALRWAGIAAIPCLVLWFVSLFAAAMSREWGYFKASLLPYLIVGTVIICSVCGVIGAVKRELERKRCNKANAVHLQNYNAAKHADAVRVNNELAQKKVLLNERAILYNRCQRTQDTLRRYYDAGVIYGKYQYDFAAVASFLDYFMSGRCSTLGENRGGDGAYNLYESELRQNLIINKLDQVLAKLDQIRDNQYSLACAIQEGNRMSQKLVKATERLAIAGEQTARNSEIAAYNSQQSANELNQIKWLQLYGMTLR